MHHALVDAFETEHKNSKCHKKKFVISMARHSRDEWNLFYGFMDEMHLKISFRGFMTDIIHEKEKKSAEKIIISIKLNVADDC